jgi:hypothetical protein
MKRKEIIIIYKFFYSIHCLSFYILIHLKIICIRDNFYHLKKEKGIKFIEFGDKYNSYKTCIVDQIQ